MDAVADWDLVEGRRRCWDGCGPMHQRQPLTSRQIFWTVVGAVQAAQELAALAGGGRGAGLSCGRPPRAGG